MSMSSKGNDLVRGLLWMACQSAIQCNPAIRALYARQKAQNKRGDVILGHCMRKMLHLVFAVWKTNKPFDPARCPAITNAALTPAANRDESSETSTSSAEPVATEASAGRNGATPNSIAVTAAVPQTGTRKIPAASVQHKKNSVLEITDAKATTTKDRRIVDFAELRHRVDMTDVLQKLDLLDRLHGTGPQRRGPCPLHDPQNQHSRSRTFSVNLDKQVFHCLHSDCRAHGNVLDLWAAFHGLTLRDAALHLADTFNIHLPNKKKASSRPTQH